MHPCAKGKKDMEKGTAAQTLSEHFFLEFYQFLDLDALGSTPIDYFAVFVAH